MHKSEFNDYFAVLDKASDRARSILHCFIRGALVNEREPQRAAGVLAVPTGGESSYWPPFGYPTRRLGGMQLGNYSVQKIDFRWMRYLTR